MKQYVILDGAYVKVHGVSPRVPDGAIEVDWLAADYTICMLVDGLWEARPEVTPPVVTLENTVTFSGLPLGATVLVRDDETNAVLADIPEEVGEVSFQLADSGIYHLEVFAPLPWLSWSGKLTC